MGNKEMLEPQGVHVAEVKEGKEKSGFTKAILGKLPEWFGNQVAVNQYAAEAVELPYWAAFNQANCCVGFFCVKTHYKNTGEIVVCGILPEYQHSGVGKILYSKAEEYFIQNGCKYSLVKTLSDIAESKPYEQTRKFYRSIGFEPLITLTEMWDEKNPCLIMLKTIS